MISVPGVNFDVGLGVEFLRTMSTLEPVARHLVGFVHVGLELGSGILLDGKTNKKIQKIIRATSGSGSLKKLIKQDIVDSLHLIKSQQEFTESFVIQTSHPTYFLHFYPVLIHLIEIKIYTVPKHWLVVTVTASCVHL